MKKKSFLFVLLISSIILCGVPGLLSMFIGVLTLPAGYKDSSALESGLAAIGVGIVLAAIPIGISVLYYTRIRKHQTRQTSLPLQPGSPQSDNPDRARIEEEIRNLTYKEKITGGTIAVERLQHIQRVRAKAASFLGDSGDARAVEPLIAALKYEDIFSKLNTGLPSDSGYDGVLGAIATALGKLRDVRAVEPLISVPSRMWLHHTEVVVNALEQIGEPAVRPLVGALRNDNLNIRTVAADALGRIGNTQAIEPLYNALKKEEDRWAESEIIDSLGKLGGAGAVDALIFVLEDEKRQFGAHESAANWLGKLGDARAIEPLIAIIEDENRSRATRGCAVKALGVLGDARAVKPLIAILKDEKQELKERLSAADLLGQLGDAGAVEPLIAALEVTNNDDLRQSITDVLHRLGWRPSE